MEKQQKDRAHKLYLEVKNVYGKVKNGKDKQLERKKDNAAKLEVRLAG